MGQGVAKGRVLTAADLSGNSRGWSDRRTEPRIPCDREILILPASAGKGQGFTGVGLFDVSARGVGIVAVEPMDVGEQFLAKLRLDRLLLVAYTVRHCTLMSDGRHFKIGAQLVAFIGAPGANPQAALEAILAAPAPLVGADVKQS